MDSAINAAARALAAGDPLAALKGVALRDDPPALALRGIAMAQLGEDGKARELLRRAARAFGPGEQVARARCVLAEAEIDLATRELAGTSPGLETAAATLARHGDHANAMHARLVEARRFLLLGRLAEAADTLRNVDVRTLPPTLGAVAELAAAELALRSLDAATATQALARADQAAYRAGIPALIAEVAEARAALQRSAARRITGGTAQPLPL
jgi:hypothetical protein